MKKMLKLVTLVALVLLLSACGAGKTDTAPADADLAEQINEQTDAVVPESPVDPPVLVENHDLDPVKGTTEEAASGFDVHVTPNDSFVYTVYGKIRDLKQLTNSDVGVIAVQPLTAGGQPYEDYPWLTCYVPAEIFTQLEGVAWKSIPENDEIAFALQVCNDADNGGYLHLPSILVDFQEIAVADIPAWFGL